MSRGRYGSKKRKVDGVTFDSMMEADFYILLKDSDDVVAFEIQPRFLLQEAFRKGGKAVRKIEYVADFKVLYKDKKFEVIDVKGMQTDVFKIKKKMFDHRYRDIELILIKKTAKGWVRI
jgi:Protein of unknown function (DUF1064)